MRIILSYIFCEILPGLKAGKPVVVDKDYAKGGSGTQAEYHALRSR